jgi:DNA-directed RNA polymerase subunit beta
MLTIKSDDIIGRSATFDAIVKNMPIEVMNSPASFNVMVNNLRGLCLDIELQKNSVDGDTETVSRSRGKRKTKLT